MKISEFIEQVELFLSEFEPPEYDFRLNNTCIVVNHELFLNSHYEFIAANINCYNKHTIKPYIDRLSFYIKHFNNESN